MFHRSAVFYCAISLLCRFDVVLFRRVLFDGEVFEVCAVLTPCSHDACCFVVCCCFAFPDYIKRSTKHGVICVAACLHSVQKENVCFIHSTAILNITAHEMTAVIMLSQILRARNYHYCGISLRGMPIECRTRTDLAETNLLLMNMHHENLAAMIVRG